MRVLTLIPARGGSKGIPRKNIRDLGGKPLLSYTIEAARSSRSLRGQDIVCSTDSVEICRVAKEHGADVPFLRPPELATDEATSAAVAIHALEWMRANRERTYDYLLLLQPTSPLRSSFHIDEALGILLETGGDSVVSVCEAHQRPHHMMVVNDHRFLSPLMPDSAHYSRRQDMPRVYVTNGAIYCTRVEWLVNRRSFVGESCIPYVMSRWCSVDIDDEYDWDMAEHLIRRQAGLKQ